MSRVSITEVMRESGLSRATVDRVLNKRGGVHRRTQDLVERTLVRLSTPPLGAAHTHGGRCDILVRLGRGMTAQLQSALGTAGQPGCVFHDLYQADDASMLQAVTAQCEDVTRPLVLTAKLSERLVAQLVEARQRGKIIITLISDLPLEARDVFVGIDNRAAGQTAAYLIGRALGDRSTTVGVVLGDHAYRCHEDREIGFRTALRTHFPKVVLAGEALGADSPSTTRDAVRRLLRDNPAIAAVYNVGGGNAGLVDAIRDMHREREILIVGHETNHITVPFLRDGLMDYLIAQDPSTLLNEALRQATRSRDSREKAHAHIDFGVFTRFNVPSFGRDIG
ncbi:MAG: substrate-binding periplasmic fold protein [Cypionkella sp.]|uniref:LacI family DNA-binding transcriptional regulator n=1 Tax=Cypionkella sp. TaxID=2811411 RepID=UPI0026016CCB|nr:LacI family DNA-binding transcriptional regulator [Cypionkella sp.]MDB5657614.1 substrate-binding periplasmic fold protein [Cypionkella sp.]